MKSFLFHRPNLERQFLVSVALVVGSSLIPTTILGSVENLQTNSELVTDRDKQGLSNEISVASLRLNQQVENLLNISTTGLSARPTNPGKNTLSTIILPNNAEMKWKR